MYDNFLMNFCKTSVSLSRYSRTAPAIAKMKSRTPLTKDGSSKNTQHIVLDIRELSLLFNVGDSLGIYPYNDPLLVEHILTALHATGEESILDPKSGTSLSLREFFTYKANLSRLNSTFLKLFYEHDPAFPLHMLLQKENRTDLMRYLREQNLLGFLKEVRECSVPFQELCNAFSPLLPRFYSIASSPLMFPQEIHLVVALFVYTHCGEKCYGVASHFLHTLVQENSTSVPLFVQPAHQFFLPKEDHLPIIMIGPGAGVAPFRAFLQERMARNAPGKNWLFFGERNRTTDFFYREFFEELVLRKKLKLDLAFSRDQSEKIYVQQRMREQAKTLWAWLQEGAFLYVCGDAECMAKDVEATLCSIAQEQGGLSEEQAIAYIKMLRQEKRYMRDVY